MASKKVITASKKMITASKKMITASKKMIKEGTFEKEIIHGTYNCYDNVFVYWM